MKEAFIEKRFTAAHMEVIENANDIVDEYQAQGYVLTLRQLFYQFVSRDLIPNTMQSYKRLGSIVNDARLAGYIDWDAIEDRTRNLASSWHARGPKEAIQVIRDQYAIDMWANQPERVEVWIEKEALVGVIDRICDELDVPYFACRGYVSQSEQWRAYQRFDRYYNARDQRTTILHLGDHDPSGIDMTRDNRDRLELFLGFGCEDIVRVKRIALNMDQVEEYDPPPNPAKVTDSRFEKYLIEHGGESWELDALEPRVLNDLIRDEVLDIRDEDLYQEKVEQLEAEEAVLDDIIEGLDKE